MKQSDLSPKIQRILTEYMQRQMFNVPWEALLVQILIVLARTASFDRLRLKSRVLTSEIPCNIYGMIFLNSGGGKDFGKHLADRLLADVNAKMKKRSIQWKSDQMEKLRVEARTKHKSDLMVERYVHQNQPRALEFAIDEATPEAFVAARVALSQAGFGGSYITNSEFAYYLASDAGYKQDFLTALAQSYDLGDTPVKALKSAISTPEVKGVPSSALLFTSPNRFREDPKLRNILKDRLGTQYARRILFCMPEPLEYRKPPEMDDAIVIMQLVRDMEADIQTDIGLMYDSINGHSVYGMSKAADEIFYQYRNKCEQESQVIYNGSLAPHHKDLAWRALKLSGLIAAFEEPERRSVSPEHYTIAMGIVEMLEGHFKRFVQDQEKSDVVRLFEFLCIEPRKTMDIRGLNLIHKDRFAGWFKVIMEEEVKPYAQSQGFVLEIGGNKRIGQTYQFIKSPYE